jgi:hypothetical protein
MLIVPSRAPGVDRTLLMRSFVVSIEAASVDVSPKYSKRLPPTMIRTLFISSFSGLTATTVLAYVTLFPFGTCDFLIHRQKLVPYTLCVPSAFLPTPLNNPPCSLLAAALDQVSLCFGSFKRSLYSIDCPVSSSIMAHARYLYSC